MFGNVLISAGGEADGRDVVRPAKQLVGADCERANYRGAEAVVRDGPRWKTVLTVADALNSDVISVGAHPHVVQA